MVAVEWARVIAFDAGDRPVIEPREFGARRPSRMKLRLQPYLSLLKLDYPVDRMLGRLVRTERATASQAASRGTLKRKLRLAARPAASPIHLAVHRSELLVYYKRLEPEAWHLLKLLGEGRDLGTACEAAFEGTKREPGEIAGLVRAWFAAWTSFGWLCG
jgi:hypothetical protein